MYNRTRIVLAVASGICIALVMAVALSWRVGDEAPPEPEHAASSEADVEASPGIPSAMDMVLSSEHSARDRILALREIRRPLKPDEIGKLMGVVRDKDAHPTLRNDIMARLTRDSLRPPTLGAELVEMWRDESEDPVWRDYALQHMDMAYDFSSDRELIAGTLVEAASAEGAMGGTALLTLGRLAERHGDLKDAVEELAVEVALSESTDTDMLVTALQVARPSGEGSAAVLERARSLAADERAAARVRMSATATVAELGDSNDLELLERLAADGESRVCRAAAYNLRRLEERLRAGR